MRPSDIKHSIITIIPTKHSNEVDKIVTKNAQPLNLEEIRSALVALKPYANLPIKSLQKDEEKYLSVLRVNVYRHKQDSDAYRKIYSLFEQEFAEFKDKLTPGTVAAFVIGSAAAKGITCHPLSANAAVSPNVDFVVCGDRILYATSNGKGGYDITNLHGSENKTAIIYIESDVPYKGFDSKEIEQIKSHEVMMASVATYNKNTKETSVIISQRPLAELQTRVSTTPTTNQPQDKTMLYIILVILILIIIFVMWRMYHNKK